MPRRKKSEPETEPENQQQVSQADTPVLSSSPAPRRWYGDPPPKVDPHRPLVDPSIGETEVSGTFVLPSKVRAQAEAEAQAKFDEANKIRAEKRKPIEENQNGKAEKAGGRAGKRK